MTLRGSEEDAKALRRLIKGYGERTASKAIWQAVRDVPGYLKRIDELTSKVAELHRALDGVVNTRIRVEEAEREQEKAIARARLLHVEAMFW